MQDAAQARSEASPTSRGVRSWGREVVVVLLCLSALLACIAVRAPPPPFQVLCSLSHQKTPPPPHLHPNLVRSGASLRQAKPVANLLSSPVQAACGCTRAITTHWHISGTALHCGGLQHSTSTAACDALGWRTYRYVPSKRAHTERIWTVNRIHRFEKIQVNSEEITQ